ncbi:MAG: asparaginase [Pseudomonadota bacterium]
MPKKSKSVYVLCTGGTISMQKTAQGYAPAAGHLAKAMAQIPELNNPDMPDYEVHDFERPVDSANITPAHWQKIGEMVRANYDKFDGFVILHGTDTMAYTASALSFMFEDLAKPVILTGSQLPLFETRSDARENLINAMLFASQYRVPEVCIYFNNKLFRGNRCKKMDASSFAAYGSPNFPVLGKVGTEILLRHHLLRHTTSATMQLQAFSPLAISALRLFPGLSLNVLQNQLREPLRALVLETYGLGTAPEDDKFLEIIREATAQGIVIVNCSQCPTAKVKMRQYAAGTSLLNAGVISGGDMTTEAALTKLFYLFSKNLDINEIKQQIKADLRGELSL